MAADQISEAIPELTLGEGKTFEYNFENWPATGTVWVEAKPSVNKPIKFINLGSIVSSRLCYMYFKINNSKMFFKNFSKSRAEKWRGHLLSKEDVCLTFQPEFYSPRLPLWFFLQESSMMLEIKINPSNKSFEIHNLYPERVEISPDRLNVALAEIDNE